MNKNILFVCTGNICRSSSAEAMLRHMANKSGHDIKIDSAGTHGYHIGETSDDRAVEHALRREIDMRGITARKVDNDDFNKFDLIIAMDSGHLRHLNNIKPKNSMAQICLFTDFISSSDVTDVLDPYYGGSEGFEVVLDMLEEGCSNILKEL